MGAKLFAARTEASGDRPDGTAAADWMAGEAGPAAASLDSMERFRDVELGVEAAQAIELDRSQTIQKVFDEEPTRLGAADFRTLLLSCVLSGASDVTIQTDRQVRAEIHGHLYLMTRRPLGNAEVGDILVESFGGPSAGAHADTQIKSKKVLDYSYQIRLLDGRRQRFRCNATGIHASSGSGVEITFRALPWETPDVSGVGLGPDMLAAMTPRDGLVVVAGATGQGKSTSLAAVVRELLEDNELPKKVVDIQAPIEFTFEDIWSNPSAQLRCFSTIGQSEVGRHIETFAEGVRSALRRKPHVIVVGEARDYETIAASLEAAITGHLVYTTTHAGSVPDVMRRLLAVFPAAEREARAYDLVSALRMMMVQVLVPMKEGRGRVPVREYLVVTDDLREMLLTKTPSDWPGILTTEMGKPAGRERQSLSSHAGQLLEEGKIGAADCRRLSRVAV